MRYQLVEVEALNNASRIQQHFSNLVGAWQTTTHTWFYKCSFHGGLRKRTTIIAPRYQGGNQTCKCVSMSGCQLTTKVVFRRDVDRDKKFSVIGKHPKHAKLL